MIIRPTITKLTQMSRRHTSTGLYPLTKGLGQEICKVFTEHYDIYVLCYLFLSFREHEDQAEGTDLNPFFRSVGGTQVKRSDWVWRLIWQNSPSRCEIFNIFADLPHQQFSNIKTKRILGFAPQDNFERMWHKKD